MFRMHLGLVWALGLAVAVSWGVWVPQACAQTGPVVYQGTLADGVPFSGTVSTAGGSTDPEFAAFYSIFGLQGEEVTISVDRVESDLDPALWVFEGLFEDISEFGGFFDQADPRFIDFADDEVANAGPFGDPSTTFVLPSEGIGAYTIAVVNFASGPNDGGDGSFDFTVNVDGNVVAGIPEPSSLVMLAVGSVVMLRRRR